MSVKSEQMRWALILLFSIAIVLLIGFNVTIDALTKIEKDALKEQIEILEERITIIENDIQTQKEIILEKKKFVEEKKAELKLIEQQANTSWDAVQKISQAKQDVINAENELAGSKEQLISLLNTKSDFKRKLENYKISIQGGDFEPQPVPITENKTKMILNQTISTPTKIITISYDLTGLRNNIGVTLSQSCLTAIKNNLSTVCPTYENLVNIDSSNTYVSGNFITTNGFFHRNTSPMQESWRWYDMDQTSRIFIDPSGGMMDKIKMITIVPNLDTYYQKSDMVRKQTSDGNKQEIIRVLYHDRYMKECKEATINAGNWKNLLNDTIIYMQNNCNAAFTQIETIELIYANKTQFDIGTSWKWQNDKWMEWIKEFCLFTYGICKD